jgi:hypothetical protein
MTSTLTDCIRLSGLMLIRTVSRVDVSETHWACGTDCRDTDSKHYPVIRRPALHLWDNMSVKVRRISICGSKVRGKDVDVSEQQGFLRT